ncbi:hemicentin-1-like isoform X1 [Metopolophium dirhodum]|uniref:hemicentin-1-like isoform X1 n=1 Tax=Metopolophium dirhodum TaxID=44670 RepID=UPI0029904D15|nr:hemicentin-1-like isoform X1 [Metopolophium dirhodum]
MNWLVSLTIVCLAVQCSTAVQYPEDVYSSLAFVFDTTGSMENDYVQLKSHAESIMNYVLTRNNTDIKHFVFVPFNDPDVGPVTETFDPKVIMHKLNQVLIRGGGDCPEMGITAVIQALKVVKPNSYIYVFTDAPPKDSHLVYDALELIQRKQSQVVVLRTMHDCISTDKSYENIASLGSGSVFDVNKEDVSKVLQFVKTSMDTNRVNLMSVNIPQKQLIPFPKKLNIDESIKSLQVSVSGLNSNIGVVNPVGKKMDEAHGLITDLDLKNVKIVNILEPIPGEWTLYITSESAHTIRACGISTKNFDFGFATSIPKNMTQTSHRPLKGAKNYILVNCPDVKKFVSCKIQDLSSDGTTEALPVLDFGRNLLLCGPFIPNDNPFYVQVFGMNNNGNYFRRITKTSIIPNEPDAPYITTTTKAVGVVGGELHVNCHVESLVPFTVTWESRNYPQQAWNFSQSSEIELVVRNVTFQHEGIFTCGAQNIAGYSESTTNVTIISKPTIAEGNDNVTLVLSEGGDYVLKCTGQGVPSPQMIWLMNGFPVTYYNDHILVINDFRRLIIYDTPLGDSNVFTCRASNEAGAIEKNYKIVVKGETPFPMIANESLIINELDDVLMNCPLTNMTHKWLKDGVNVNDLVYKRADEQHFKQINRSLKIYELDELDGGVYTCMSSYETYTFHLRIAFAPLFIKYQPETMMISKNETVVFDCRARGFPKPRVYWRKLESALPITPWTLKDTEYLEDKQVLKIHNIDWIHNGTYSCIVKNKLGSEKRRFELYVF